VERRVTIYLVRHAEAEAATAGGDAARQLTDAGRDAFAAFVAARRGDLAPARVLTSPYLRARQTAALLAAAAGAAVEDEPALASGASGGRALLALARSTGDGTALVGHNPEIAEAIALAGGHDVAVRPGTVAAVELADDGGARLAWIAAPGG
jgi:phosphohistidine phosphatase